VSPAPAESDRSDVALSSQDVTTSHAMLTEVAQAFVGIVAGFQIRVVAAAQGRELGPRTRRASSVPVNKPFRLSEGATVGRALRAIKGGTGMFMPVERRKNIRLRHSGIESGNT
jgi:hypothetical protein